MSYRHCIAKKQISEIPKFHVCKVFRGNATPEIYEIPKIERGMAYRHGIVKNQIPTIPEFYDCTMFRGNAAPGSLDARGLRCSVWVGGLECRVSGGVDASLSYKKSACCEIHVAERGPTLETWPRCGAKPILVYIVFPLVSTGPSGTGPTSDLWRNVEGNAWLAGEIQGLVLLLKPAGPPRCGTGREKRCSVRSYHALEPLNAKEEQIRRTQIRVIMPGNSGS